MNVDWFDDVRNEEERPDPPQKFWLPRIYDRSRFDPSWYTKWAPRCPNGNPQRMCEIVGFRLKGADYLQLRVILCDEDHGVCQLVVEEHEDVVFVHALACFEPAPEPPPRKGRKKQQQRHETNCPCNHWLDFPLGARVIVNYETDRPLPLCIPHWGEDKPDEYIPRPLGDLWETRRLTELTDQHRALRDLTTPPTPPEAPPR
jgi:hypothetical protein